MVDRTEIMEGVDFAVRAGAEAMRYATDFRYNQLSHILLSLQTGHTPGLLRELDVTTDRPALTVDLKEWPYFEDRYPYPTTKDVTVDSTRTIMTAHWGDDGSSKLYVVANQDRIRRGRTETRDYESGRLFLDNSLHLGGLLHVARTAKHMQRAQKSAAHAPIGGRIADFAIGFLNDR